jgi:hypothetical protein
VLSSDFSFASHGNGFSTKPKPSRTEAWECRVQRRDRQQTRQLHTEADFNAYRALVMCYLGGQGSQKSYRLVKHETETSPRWAASCSELGHLRCVYLQ